MTTYDSPKPNHLENHDSVEANWEKMSPQERVAAIGKMLFPNFEVRKSLSTSGEIEFLARSPFLRGRGDDSPLEASVIIMKDGDYYISHDTSSGDDTEFFPGQFTVEDIDKSADNHRELFERMKKHKLDPEDLDFERFCKYVVGEFPSQEKREKAEKLFEIYKKYWSDEIDLTEPEYRDFFPEQAETEDISTQPNEHTDDIAVANDEERLDRVRASIEEMPIDKPKEPPKETQASKDPHSQKPPSLLGRIRRWFSRV